VFPNLRNGKRIAGSLKVESKTSGDTHMDKRAVRKDGRAFGVNNLIAIETYIDPDYELELCHNNRATDTMYLIVGKLIPSDSALPSFIFRWDENQDQFDVDIENVNDKTKKKFNAEKDGYKGHHPRRLVNKDGRYMAVDISLPNRRIFQGTIVVPLAKEVVIIFVLRILIGRGLR